jgi:phosphonopyruvate decarboxylase
MIADPAPSSVARRFVDALERQGFDFFTGVPCSLVKNVWAELEARGLQITETREDAALGLAAGAYLGGRLPVVIMQNSGFGVSLNALASLHRLYRIPCLLVITWRGHDGADAPEHNLLGPVTPTLLDVMGIPHRAPERPEEFIDAVAWAGELIARTREPAAIVVRPELRA